MASVATGEAAAAPAIDPRLAAWERRMNPWIIAAAIVPIIGALANEGSDDPYLILDLATWGVFVADLVVHIRYRHRYLRTGLGLFDLSIVVLTFPWYVIPAFSASAVLGLARLGRVARLLLAGSSTGLLRRLIQRLGRAGLYSVVLILVAATVVKRVEPPSSGFETFGDAVWWAIVTFTTVGYGDLVPETSEGRIMGVCLMLGGIALIGLLAGSLAEFFTDDADEDEGDEPGGSDAGHDGDAARGDGADGAVLAELRALRSEVAGLRAALESPPTR